MKLNRVTLIALIAAVGGVTASCSSGSNVADGNGAGPEITEANNLGSLEMNLVLPNGSTITSVAYSVVGPVTRTGSINVGNAQNTVSGYVLGLPAGTYAVSLTTTTSTGITCRGTANATVIAGQPASVSVTINCGTAAANQGSLAINGSFTFNSTCSLDSMSVFPLQSAVGAPIDLTGAASSPSGGVVYAWSATNGAVGSVVNSVSGSVAQFNCGGTGPATVTLAITDADGCTAQNTVNLACFGTVTCGDGVTVAAGGEQCDDGNTASGDGCSATCQTEICGDNIVQVGLGETCELPNTATCDASCHSIVCGDGVQAASEACDDGNLVAGDGCSATCLLEPVVCGDGIKAPSEQCDDGNTVGGDACNADCTLPSACAVCTAASCGSQVTACTTFGAGCTNALSCMNTNTCWASTGLLEDCWCGVGIDTLECALGNVPPTGPCKTPIEAGLALNGVIPTSPVTIGQRYFDPAFPGGAAMQVLLCERANCSAACGI
jgi:cysteine-rich repeat protein